MDCINCLTRCPNVTTETMGSHMDKNVSSATIVTLKKPDVTRGEGSNAIFGDGSDSQEEEEEFYWVEVVELSCEAANDSVSSDKLPPHQSVEKHSQETKESAAHNSPPKVPKKGALFGHTTSTSIRDTNYSMVNIGGENDMGSDSALGASEFQTRVTTVDGISLLQNDQLSYCPFCEKCYKGDLSEHCVEAQTKPVGVKNRLNEGQKKNEWMLKWMQNVGNFGHNCKVIRRGSGELIISQPIPGGSALSDFTPCPVCLGFFNWKLLLEHKCERKSKNDIFSGMTVISDSKLLLPLSREVANYVSSFVVNSCQDMEDIFTKDSLLREFSHREFARFNLNGEESAQVKTKILNLSKFLAQLDETNSATGDIMQQLIGSGRSQEIVTGLKKFCESNKIEGKSSEAFVKLISSLRECGVVLRAKALEDGNWLLQERSLKFIDLCDSWLLEATGGRMEQENLPQVLTDDFVRILTEDVVQLWTHLCEVCTRHKELLMNANTEVFSSETLKLLVTMSKVVLAKVFLFNNEEEESCIAKMKVADFRNRDPPRNGDVENCTSLNWRDHLLNSLVRVSVKNEAGIKRTILLTEDMVECINLLISKRDVAYVSPKNEDVFIFALFKRKGIPVRVSDCVKEFFNNCSMISRNLLMCPKLRKFLAFAVQLTCLSRVKSKLVAYYIRDCNKGFKKVIMLNKETTQVLQLVMPFLDRGVTLRLIGNDTGRGSSQENLQGAKVKNKASKNVVKVTEKRNLTDGNAGFYINAGGTKRRKKMLQTEGEDDHNSKHVEKERQEADRRRSKIHNLIVLKEIGPWKNPHSIAKINVRKTVNGPSEKTGGLKETLKNGDVLGSVGIFAKRKNKTYKSAPVKRTKKRKLKDGDTGIEINAGDIKRRKKRLQTEGEVDHDSEHVEKERQEAKKRRKRKNLRVIKEIEQWKNRDSTGMISTDIITNGQSEKNGELKEKSKQMLGDVHESVGVFAKMKNKSNSSAPVKRTKKRELRDGDTRIEINAGVTKRRKERLQTEGEVDHDSEHGEKERQEAKKRRKRKNLRVIKEIEQWKNRDSTGMISTDIITNGQSEKNGELKEKSKQMLGDVHESVGVFAKMKNKSNSSAPVKRTKKRELRDGDTRIKVNAGVTKRRKERLQTEGEVDHDSEHGEKERQEAKKRRKRKNLRVIKEIKQWKNRDSTGMISTDIITNGQSEKNGELKEKSKQMLGDVHESVGGFAKMKNKSNSSAPVKRTKKRELRDGDTRIEINAGVTKRRKERLQTEGEEGHNFVGDRLKGTGAPEFVGIVIREREENQRYSLRKVRIRNFKEKIERNVCRYRIKARRKKISVDEEKNEDDGGRESEDKQVGMMENQEASSGRDCSDEKYITSHTSKSRRRRKGLLNRRSRLAQRVQWNQEEKAAIYRHLEAFITKNILPGKEDIMNCKNRENVLDRRTWKNVKDFCRYAAIAGKRKELLNRRRFSQKIQWNQEEKAAIYRHLEAFITKNILPGKEDVMNCKNRENVLDNRTWQNVKDFCRNAAVARKRELEENKSNKRAAIRKGKKSKRTYRDSRRKKSLQTERRDGHNSVGDRLNNEDAPESVIIFTREREENQRYSLRKVKIRDFKERLERNVCRTRVKIKKEKISIGKKKTEDESGRETEERQVDIRENQETSSRRDCFDEEYMPSHV